MAGNDDKVGEGQREEAEVDALSQPVTPKHRHVQQVGRHGHEEERGQYVDVEELVDVLLSLAGDEVLGVTPGREEGEGDHQASLW